MYITGKYMPHVRTGRDVSFVWSFPFVFSSSWKQRHPADPGVTTLRATSSSVPVPWTSCYPVAPRRRRLNLLIGLERSRHLEAGYQPEQGQARMSSFLHSTRYFLSRE